MMKLISKLKMKNYKVLAIEREFIPVFHDYHETTNKELVLLSKDDERLEVMNTLKQDGKELLVHKEIRNFWSLVGRNKAPIIGDESKSYKDYKPNVIYEYDASTELSSDELRLVLAVLDGYILSVNQKGTLKVLSYDEVDRIEEKGFMRIIKESEYNLYKR